MLEELIGVAPLVILKLPRLARGENADDAVPVLRLELLGTLDEDEAQGPRRVDVGHAALHVEHAGRRGGRVRVRGHELAVLEEGADVGEAEKGRGGGREEDDGVWSPGCGFLIEGDLGSADVDGLWLL